MEPVDILPANCSGLCMAACLSLAFVVLQWPQATPPDKPIVVKGTVNRTHNNSCGWVIPYGGLQHLTPEQVEELANSRTATGSDGLADYVSTAESSAALLKEAWNRMKAAGERAGGTPSKVSCRTPTFGRLGNWYLCRKPGAHKWGPSELLGFENTWGIKAGSCDAEPADNSAE